MKTGWGGGAVKRKRNKLKALPSPPARVQFLFPKNPGSRVQHLMSASSPCLVRMVLQEDGWSKGHRRTVPWEQGKQKCEGQTGIQKYAQSWAWAGMRPLVRRVQPPLIGGSTGGRVNVLRKVPRRRLGGVSQASASSHSMSPPHKLMSPLNPLTWGWAWGIVPQNG